MLAVILKILSVVGHILLILLLILLALLLCMLFVPVCYRAHAVKEGEKIRADAAVHWLLHIVHFTLHFEKDDGMKSGPEMKLRVFGIPVWHSGETTSSGKKRGGRKSAHVRHPASSRKKTAPENIGAGSGSAGSRAEQTSEQGSGPGRRTAHKKPTIRPGERGAAEKERDIEVEVVRTKRPNFFVRLGAKISAVFGKIRGFFRKIADFFGELRKKFHQVGLWLDYFQSDEFADAREAVKREGIPLVRHILPRKMKGYVEFGMDDPAATGQTLGVIAVLYPVLPDGLEIRPDFLEKKFDADVDLSGHIVIAVLVFRAVRLFMNRNFRALVQTIRSRDPEWQKKQVHRRKRKKAGGIRKNG